MTLHEAAMDKKMGKRFSLKMYEII